MLWRFEGGTGPCSIARDGALVAVADGKSILLHDATTGKSLGPPLAHENQIYSAAFSPDGKKLVTASADNTARIWDTVTWKALHTLRHDGMIWTAVFSPDGRRIVTASADHQAKIWDVATGDLLLALTHADQVVSAAFGQDASKVLTVGTNLAAKVYVWDPVTGKLLCDPLGVGSVDCAAFSPDGMQVVTGDEDGLENAARVWDTRTGRQLTRTARHWGRVTSVVFSPDGKKIATSTDGSIRVWDARNGNPLTKPLGDGVSMMSRAIFSPDGTRVLGMGEGGQAIVWEVATGKWLAAARGADVYTSGAFGPAGKYFIVTGQTLVGHRSCTSAWAVPLIADK